MGPPPSLTSKLVAALAADDPETAAKRVGEIRRRLALALAEVAEVHRSKEEFLANLSHELRTPLNAVLGWTRLLRTGGLDSGTTEHALELIERNTRTQARLINDLFDVSRLATGKVRLDLETVDMDRLVGECLDTVRPAADAKHVRLHISHDRRSAAIEGDADRLRQVLWNLLSNAVKFTGAGGVVEVRLTRRESEIEVCVRDTGIGIRAEFLPYAFDRFRQADPSVTRRYGGLGLGLAIVRHIVELHGGTVSVESAGPGQGCRFTVRLPTKSRHRVQDEGTFPGFTPAFGESARAGIT
jgi:signal transduction histidine kinase